MKLTDLNPRFTHDGPQKVLVFECPKCQSDGKDVGEFTGHCFRIPIDGDRPWHIDREDFQTLTMRPSVLDLTPGGCHVHFYITKGEIELLP